MNEEEKKPLNLSELLRPIEDEEPEVDNFHGVSGWVVVACGTGDRCVFLDIAQEFGALRYWTTESGLHDPEEAGLAPPGDGLWRCQAKASFSKDWESGISDLDGFDPTGPWEQVVPDGTGWKAVTT